MNKDYAVYIWGREMKKPLKVITALAGVSNAAGVAGKKVYSKYKEQAQKTESPHEQGIYEKYIKRPQDFCCALVADDCASSDYGNQPHYLSG